jgi:hypothetical protein
MQTLAEISLLPGFRVVLGRPLAHAPAEISIIPPFQQFVKQNLFGIFNKIISRNLYILPIVI